MPVYEAQILHHVYIKLVEFWIDGDWKEWMAMLSCDLCRTAYGLSGMTGLLAPRLGSGQLIQFHRDLLILHSSSVDVL